MFGVVVGFNVPTRTKTDSWMVTIAIVDQSFPMDSNHNNDELGAMNVNIFRKNCEDFPKCRRAGDVIRLQEAGIQVSWFLLIGRERLRFFLKKFSPGLS